MTPLSIPINEKTLMECCDALLYKIAVGSVDERVKAFAEVHFKEQYFTPRLEDYDTLNEEGQCLLGFQVTLNYLATGKPLAADLLRSRLHPLKESPWLEGSSLAALSAPLKDPLLSREMIHSVVTKAFSTHHDPLTDFLCETLSKMEVRFHATSYLYREYCKTAHVSEPIRLLRDGYTLAKESLPYEEGFPIFRDALHLPSMFGRAPVLEVNESGEILPSLVEGASGNKVSFYGQALHRYWAYCKPDRQEGRMPSDVGDPSWSEHHWNKNPEKMQRALADTFTVILSVRAKS